MKQVNVKATRHADITGKELLYIVMSDGKQNVIINVGTKTFDKVENLLKEEPINKIEETLQKEVNEPNNIKTNKK